MRTELNKKHCFSPQDGFLIFRHIKEEFGEILTDEELKNMDQDELGKDSTLDPESKFR